MYAPEIDIVGLAQLFRGRGDVYYRLVAERIDGSFQVTRLIIGPQANWEKYEYKDVIFVAGTTRGENITGWLLGKTVITWDKQLFPILPMSSQVSSSWYPSHSQAGLFTPSKPCTLYRIAFSQAVPGRDYDFISSDAPFFLTRWEAERHLLYDIAEDSGYSAWRPPEPGIDVYIENTDAWLERIHFSPIRLEIHVSGTDLTDTKLKVVGSGIQNYDGCLNQQDVITIPLPDGRPDYLKIALIKGNTLLDYYIDYKDSRSNPFSLQRTNVTFAEPEPKDRVQDLIDRGEGRTIEFKAEISLSQDKWKWLKTIAAFANGDGGSLLLGVSDEDGAIVGFNQTLSHHKSIAKLKDDIVHVICDNIDPVPSIDFTRVNVNNHDILVIDVQGDRSQLYAAYHDRKIPTFYYYIRRGATTRVADSNEAQELMKLKSLWTQGNNGNSSRVYHDLS